MVFDCEQMFDDVGNILALKIKIAVYLFHHISFQYFTQDRQTCNWVIAANFCLAIAGMMIEIHRMMI